MIVHDELYILLNGSRRKIEIQNPSGISLKFQSNMFNDLSKFCASYSYTFKIPKTRNNIEAFDLVDEIRYSSVAYGKKIQCELYRDGVKLFDDSYLYINEGGKEYSAVITWNVLSWLLEINESGKSIKDIEKDFAGSQMTFVDFNDNRYNITNAQNMGNPYVNSLFRSGTPFYTSTNPKAVPVRYLLDRISRYFGKGDATDMFSFLRSTPLTNEDFKNADHLFNIADDGAIPMVNGKWSNNWLQTQIRSCSKVASTKYDQEFPMLDVLGNDLDNPSKSDGILFMQKGIKQFLFFSDVSGSSEYVKFYRHTGTATKGEDVFIKDEDGNDTDVLDLNNTTWTKDATPNGMYMGFASVNWKLPIVLHGRIRVTDYGRLVLVPFVSSNTTGIYTPILDDEGVMQEVIEIESTEVEGTSGMYEFNFDPAQGGTEVEVEYVENVVFWVAQLQISNETFVVDGYLNFLPNRENVTFGFPNPPSLNVVDMFFNLPDIKIIDLLKSLFYIENAYPFIEKDGRIGQMRYEDLYTNIRNGNVYDWSNILVGDAKNDSVKYTNGNLGRVNRFNMKNYSSTGNEEEQTALRYDEASSYFVTDNESLSAENTIYTFPFSSAAKVTKNGFSAGDTNIFWELDDSTKTYKVAGSVEPIIGRIRDYKHGTYWKGQNFSFSLSESLKFEIWQVANQEYDNSVIAQIFRKPYVVTTKVFLDTFTLSTLDFTKPVYISRYNAYFGIISVQCDSKGMSKAELIKLPSLDMSGSVGDDPEITISGSPVVYKKSNSSAIAKYGISSFVRGSRINRMVVSVDDEVVADKDMEAFDLTVRYEFGTHVLSVTVYTVDGRTKTEYFETRVDYAAEKASIDFLEYTSGLYISNTKRNVAKFKVALYNSTSDGMLAVYKYKRGTSSKVLLGSTNQKTLEFEWEYFDQLGSTGTQSVNWVLSAEFNSSTENVVATKNVLVSVDRQILKSYDGIVSGMYFQMTNSRGLFTEGSYIDEPFKYGDFEATYMVVGAQVVPYYVEIHFLCYTSSGSTIEYVHGIDPYHGVSETFKLAKSIYGSYQRIQVTAQAWYYDKIGYHYTSNAIWLYRDKQ